LRKIGTALVELDSTRIIFEDDNELVLPGVLAREGVLRYSEGYAYRPAIELESSLFSFEGAFVVSGAHPDTMILTDPGLVSGRVTKVAWDAERGEVHGQVHLYKQKISADFLGKVKAGVLSKNSMGFLYEEERAPGEWRGQRYDFVQRKILVDHVAVGVPFPRDPGCTLGMDSEPNLSGGIEVTTNCSQSEVCKPEEKTCVSAVDLTRMLLPRSVIEENRRLLSNMSPYGEYGDRTKCYDQREMVRSPPRRGVINSENGKQVEII